jgi:hypothetical protein
MTATVRPGSGKSSSTPRCQLSDFFNPCLSLFDEAIRSGVGVVSRRWSRRSMAFCFHCCTFIVGQRYFLQHSYEQRPWPRS